MSFLPPFHDSHAAPSLFPIKKLAPALPSSSAPSAPQLSGQHVPTAHLTQAKVASGSQSHPLSHYADNPVVNTQKTAAIASTSDPEQHCSAAQSAAHENIAVTDADLIAQKKQMEDRVHHQAADAKADAEQQMNQLQKLKDGGDKSIEIKRDKDGTEHYYQKSVDPTGRVVETKIVRRADGLVVVEEMKGPDPADPSSGYTYANRLIQAGGQDAWLHTTEEKFKSGMPQRLDKDSTFVSECNNSTRTEESTVDAKVSQEGVSIHSEQRKFDFPVAPIPIYQAHEDIEIHNRAGKKVSAAGGADKAFDKGADILELTSSKGEAYADESKGSSTDINTRVLAQGNTRLTEVTTDGGPRRATLEKQLSNDRKITQVTVQGSPQVVETATSVQGDTVTEFSSVLDKPAGRDPSLVGIATGKRVYGTDGKLKSYSNTYEDLKTGDVIAEQMTRKVKGDQVTYDQTKSVTKRDENTQVTHGTQLNRIGVDGNESLQSNVIKTPDGKTMRIDGQSDQTRTVSIIGADGKQVSGSVQNSGDGNTTISIHDSEGKTKTIRIDCNGKVQDGNLADLPSDQATLLPALVATSKGNDNTVAGSNSALFKAVFRDKDLLEKVGPGLDMLGNTLGLAGAVANIAETKHIDPLASRTNLALSIARKPLGLIGTEFAKKLSGGLGVVGGMLNISSGVTELINSQDSYDNWSGLATLGQGGASIVGGLGALGAFGAASGPVGWIATGLGLTLIGAKFLIDKHKREYVPGLDNFLFEESNKYANSAAPDRCSILNNSTSPPGADHTNSLTDNSAFHLSSLMPGTLYAS